jgi:hypothetical protein
MAALALAVAVPGAALGLAGHHGTLAAVAGGAGLGLLAVAAAAGRAHLVGWALLGLAAAAAAALEDDASPATAPLYGAALLLAGRLAERSAELRTLRAVERPALTAWLAETAALAFAGLAAAAAVVLAGTLPVVPGLALGALGALAAVGAVLLLLALARHGPPD